MSLYTFGLNHQTAPLDVRERVTFAPDTLSDALRDLVGARQSGEALLRFADLERDVALIEQARDAADELLQKDPAAAARHLERWLGGKQEFIKA